MQRHERKATVDNVLDKEIPLFIIEYLLKVNMLNLFIIIQSTLDFEPAVNCCC